MDDIKWLESVNNHYKITMRQSRFSQFFHCLFVTSRTKELSLTYRARSSDLGQSVLCVLLI